MAEEEKQKTCRTCGKEFAILPEDIAFLSRLDLPEPKDCPVCIWKHLMSFWVFGRFRKTKSDLSGETIITTFPEITQFPLYNRNEWVSDAWDPLSYGQEYNASRPFLDQFAELQIKVPHPHQSGTKNTDCDWSDDTWNSKDCYLSRSILDCERLTYGYRNVRCKDSLDLVFSFDCELSYDSLYCFNAYKVKYSLDVRDSIESAFLYDCRNVQNCFMCWNLRSKQYHILNKPYSKEEYFKKLKEFDTRSFSGVEKLKEEFKRVVAEEAFHRENYNVNAVHSTGNFLEECKNCHSCYFLQEVENSRYSFRGGFSKDDIYTVGSIIEKGALSSVDGYNYETIVTSHCANCRYSAYLDYCEECEYCFGCVGLRKKKYCILNRQYSEIEYHALVSKIKEDMKKRGEWGEFFPRRLAYCGYNFSLAPQFFPESKETVLAQGGVWEDIHEETRGGTDTATLPDRIDDVSDSIVATPLICPKTKLRFNIAPRELAFYKEHGIPLPRYHFDYRTLERFKPLTAWQSHSGACFMCGKAIRHFYPPEWGYKKIACMDCYLKEVQ